MQHGDVASGSLAAINATHSLVQSSQMESPVGRSIQHRTANDRSVETCGHRQAPVSAAVRSSAAAQAAQQHPTLSAASIVAPKSPLHETDHNTDTPMKYVRPTNIAIRPTRAVSAGPT